MAQTLKTVSVIAGEKIVLFEKPRVSQRVFFCVRVLAGQSTWYEMQMSFGDPLFASYYALNGPEKYFEASGVDMFQGDIWLHNNTTTDLQIAATEILH